MHRCDKLDSENRSLLDAITNKVCAQSNLDVKIPATYEEAKRSEDWPLWRDACNSELTTLHKLGAYSVENDVPSNVRTSLDWAFSIEEDGRYRARMVVDQTAHFDETRYKVRSRPIPQFSHIRFFLAVAAKRSLSVSHLKFNAAHFNIPVVAGQAQYAHPPPGMAQGNKSIKDSVIKLNHYIEGYTRAFFGRDYSITKALRKHGFFPVQSDSMMFTRGMNQNSILILVSDEDLLIASSNQEKVASLKEKLISLHNMRDLGVLRKIKGIEVSFTPRFITLGLNDYISSLLRDYNMEDCVPSRIPSKDVDLNIYGNEEPCDLEEFRSLLGKLLYASTTVRCDIAHIVYDLLGAFDRPKQKHLNTAKSVVRYLKGTKTKSIHIQRSHEDSDLSNYLKANYVPRALESFTGLTAMFCGAPIYWRMYYGYNGSTSLYAYTPRDIGDEATRFHEILRRLGFDSEMKYYSDNADAYHNWNEPSTWAQPHNARKRQWQEEDTRQLNVQLVPTGPADLPAMKLPHSLHEPRCLDFGLW